MSEDTGHANPKPPSVDRLSRTWQRINDYKIAQWSVAYVAVAYGVQHAVILTSESFEWPNLVARISMLLLALGLPVVMTLAWYHGERASRQFSRAELTIISILLVIGSLFFYVFVRPSEQTAAGPAPAVQQAGLASARSASLNPGAAISIAVMPFANLSDDKQQEYFSDGMTDEIAGALAKVPDLRVVARSSAFKFKGQNEEARIMGQALGATHLIEGSVRQAGNRVRITAQLIQAENGLQIWSENYDRELNDIFAIQEDIARAITTSLRMPLGLKPGENLVNNRSIDPESYQQYLRARALVRARGGSTPLSDASALLEQVVARDADFAPAWAQLALAYALTVNFDPAFPNLSAAELRRSVDSSLPKAEAAGRRAIQLDANLADGYLSLARTLDARGKYLQAEELFSKALALDPYNPDALSLYGNLLAGVGRLKESLATKQRALALEPFVPIYNQTTTVILWVNGQTDAAIAMTKALPPGAVRAWRLAMIYAAGGRYGEAADALTEIPARNYPPGVVEAATRLLRRAPAPAASPQTLPRLADLNFVYLYVGASDRVLEYNERNVEAGYMASAGTAYFWHPSYAPVRKTERFKAFARNSGLVDYWRAKGWPDHCHPAGTNDFACD